MPGLVAALVRQIAHPGMTGHAESGALLRRSACAERRLGPRGSAGDPVDSRARDRVGRMHDSEELAEPLKQPDDRGGLQVELDVGAGPVEQDEIDRIGAPHLERDTFVTE